MKQIFWQQHYVTEFKKSWCLDNNGYERSGKEVDRLISVVPSGNQLSFHALAYYNFIHFGMNTFTDREWGNGTEDPALFCPTALDTDQWCSVLKETGSKGIIFTAKHHDGFCLFDTAYTDHSVMNSPFGKDVLALLAKSCRKYDLKLGVYLSPWDRHEATYGTEAYNTFFANQLTELCTNYGELFCFWFDGACGEGSNGKTQHYDWERYYHIIHTLQPGAVIANCGPDVRWIGNEEGKVRASEWNVIPASAVSVEAVMETSQKEDGMLPVYDAYTKDLGSREVVCRYQDLKWSPAEADISVTAGWFYHNTAYYRKKNPFGLRSARQLARIYFNTVGGNASLLLNVPPDPRGLISEREKKTLRAFAKRIRKPFAQEIPYTPSRVCMTGTPRAAETALGMLADDESGIRLTLNKKQTISTLVLCENIAFSQRVEAFSVYAKKGAGYCKLHDGTVIGTKKIIRFRCPVKTEELVLLVRQSRSNPVLSELHLYA